MEKKELSLQDLPQKVQKALKGVVRVETSLEVEENGHIIQLDSRARTGFFMAGKENSTGSTYVITTLDGLAYAQDEITSLTGAYDLGENPPVRTVYTIYYESGQCETAEIAGTGEDRQIALLKAESDFGHVSSMTFSGMGLKDGEVFYLPGFSRKMEDDSTLFYGVVNIQIFDGIVISSGRDKILSTGYYISSGGYPDGLEGAPILDENGDVAGIFITDTAGVKENGKEKSRSMACILKTDELEGYLDFRDFPYQVSSGPPSYMRYILIEIAIILLLAGLLIRQLVRRKKIKESLQGTCRT